MTRERGANCGCRGECGIIFCVMSDKLKVYLETSFVNYLTGRSTSNVKIATEQAYTRQWWETEREKCEVFVSGYTISESESGGAEYVERRMEAIKGVSVITEDAERVAELAKKLLEGHAIPEGEVTDAMHIASAAIAGMDVLLTWNCRHMANPHTLPKTRSIVTSAGYVCPAVMTPKTFIENTQLEV